MKSVFLMAFLGLAGCTSTQLIESPKTAFVAQNEVTQPPEILWTSRTVTKPFDYLGRVKVRGWSYKGALQRLIDGGQKLHADAITDIHFRPVGFLSEMEAFAIKFRN